METTKVRGYAALAAVLVLSAGCGGARSETAVESSATVEPAANATDGGQTTPQDGMAVEEGTVTASLSIESVGPERVIRLSLRIGTETQSHELGRTAGSCVIPAWTRDVIDPDGAAAGSIMSFRCRSSGREEIYRLIPTMDALEVMRATRPTVPAPEGPVGQGELVFERVNTIRLPADVHVVMEQAPQPPAE
jgi:hypothetical protein